MSKHYTPEDVKDLAMKTLGFSLNSHSKGEIADLINAAVKEAVDVEREACADICRNIQAMHEAREVESTDDEAREWRIAAQCGAEDCWEAIRARGWEG